MMIKWNSSWLLALLLMNACRPALDSDTKARFGADDAVQLKNEAYTNLSELVKSGRFLFGQQRLSLTGVGREGQNPWNDGAYGTEPDAQKLIGDQPAVLGMDVWDFAMKNPSWNQSAYTKAAKDFFKNGTGGLVTFDWHMRACDVADVTDAYGNSGVPGSGFRVDDWNQDSNRSCLCRIVNEEPWTNGRSWKDWLFTQKFDRFVSKLRAEGMDQMPMILRPFHEMNGSWFWWGAKSWDCEKHLGRKGVVTGVEAYKKLFLMSVDYLRKDQGLKNLLIAFSPDKLCKHDGHSCDVEKAKNDTVSDQELYDDFMRLYPGSKYVDVIGLDLYYAVDKGQPWEKPAYQSALFARYLKTISQIAKVEGKVAALTETGNYNLHNEVNKSSEWFSQHLLPLITGNEDIQLAYALTWENRALNLTEYYIPYLGHASYPDFRNFASDRRTMLMKDVSGLYSPNFGRNPTPQKQEFANCVAAASDPDGDGWGWENGKSCRSLICRSFESDPDGDGWGWENHQSCQTAVCSSSSVDPDGDGWGYEFGRSCRVQNSKPVPTKVYCFDGKADPDGDGWGWENSRSCEIAVCSSQAADPDGDDWGFEYGRSCKVKE